MTARELKMAAGGTVHDSDQPACELSDTSVPSFATPACGTAFTCGIHSLCGCNGDSQLCHLP